MSDSAVKLLHEVKNILERGGTFGYRSDDAASAERALDKVCAATTEAVDKIRAYFDANPGEKP